ncbi:MAG TPA: CotH kinase family protein, partial [Candidatus Sumerlaeota bacterium]|nr:CotH kinase family protein [Candidatus Sumerlaeota bacterium]
DGNDIDPNATTPINGILDHPHGERDFISRMEDIMNFNLHPSRSIPDVDYYVSMIQTEVNREADRWASSAGVSAATLVARWNNGVTNMRAFLNNRAAFMRGLIKDEFGLTGTRTITFTAAGGGNGRLLIRGRTVDLPWTGFFFGGSELSLRPFPAIGSRFQSWGGLVSSTDPLLVHTVESGTPAEIVLNFVPYTQTLKPNDVIFNEYWINDDGTSYTSIEDRPIDGDWIELLVVRDLVDLRGWRVTNSPTLASDVSDTSTGSIIFPNIPELMDIPQGTVILIITRNNDDNDRAFPEDELDSRSGRLVFYEGNGNLDVRTDPGFSIRTSNEALILLAPGDTADTGDDIGIDFIAEGNAVTPESFGISAQGVVFINSFDGIGKNDGAVFLNDQSGGFNNDDGADLNRSDFFPGPGGWIVDPPKQYTGDDHGNPNAVNYLTPGAHNHGQQTNVFYKRHSWLLY